MIYCQDDTIGYGLSLRVLSVGRESPIVLYLAGSPSEAEEIYRTLQRMTDVPFVFCALTVNDWDRLLTPWPVDGCLKGRTFSGEGGLLLSEIEGRILPELRRRYPAPAAVYLAGYSLAGLFSLWALYESRMLDGAVCCSGSLWYPGWREYARQKHFDRPVRVYLSLGKKEELSRHPVMKEVGDATRLQYELLCQDKNAAEAKLEWQEGGHFSQVPERMAMGIRWILP